MRSCSRRARPLDGEPAVRHLRGLAYFGGPAGPLTSWITFDMGAGMEVVREAGRENTVVPDSLAASADRMASSTGRMAESESQKETR